MKRNIVLSALVAGAALTAGSLSAQSSTSGFMLNAHVTGTSLAGTVDDSDAQSGAGIGLAVGYGFNERVTLLLNVDAARMEYEDEDADQDDGEFDLATADLALRFNFGSPAQKLRPYVTTGFTGVVQADEAEDIELAISGGGITLGGGLEYFFTPSLALDAALNVTTGSFTTVELDDEEEDLDAGIGFNHGRLQLGVTWHP